MAKLVSCFLFFYFYPISTFGQVYYLDSLPQGFFHKYDILFIGQQHGLSSTDSLEAALVSKLITNRTLVLLEMGYDNNFVLEKLFDESDTINYRFLEKKNNPYHSLLFKILFKAKITPKAIDVISTSDYSTEYILNKKTYESIPCENIRQDLDEFKKMEPLNVNKIKVINKMEIFLNKFYLDVKHDKDCLGSDSTKILEFLNALHSEILSIMDSSTHIPDASNFREQFMFNVLKRAILADSTSRVISLNGHGHICLDRNNKLFNIKNKSWEPLAYLTKSYFHKKKVGSIYLLSLKNDYMFKKKFPTEMKHIKNMTQPGKFQLIDLDYKDSPFNNLAKMYSYILVY